MLVAEVLAHLEPALGRAAEPVLVDGTVGLGGHAEACLRAFPALRVLGLDRDGEALALAGRRLAAFGARVQLVQASYADAGEALARRGWPAPLGVLLDVGVSSLQLDRGERGFSFRREDAPADMRFDAGGDEPTAAAYLNHVEERELARVLFELGGEPRARAVARALVRARPFSTVGQIAAVARRHALRLRRIDPATRTFQALRMAVNDEPGHLARGLAAALALLAPGGRLVVIAFHSGEERLVKAAFRDAQRAGRGRVLTRKPVRAGEPEVRANPRARPARLRAFEVGSPPSVGEAGSVADAGSLDEDGSMDEDGSVDDAGAMDDAGT